jgi:hypothetical protein
MAMSMLCFWRHKRIQVIVAEQQRAECLGHVVNEFVATDTGSKGTSLRPGNSNSAPSQSTQVANVFTMI